MIIHAFNKNNYVGVIWQLGGPGSVQNTSMAVQGVGTISTPGKPNSKNSIFRTFSQPHPHFSKSVLSIASAQHLYYER